MEPVSDFVEREGADGQGDSVPLNRGQRTQRARPGKFAASAAGTLNGLHVNSPGFYDCGPL